MTHLFTYTKGTALKLILALSLLTGYASAQTYPVQTHVVTTGPYLNYLSYYGDENNHLQITLTNTDFTAPSPLVRLRLRFEGQGWEVYTNPNATIGQPILLDAGMPVTISGSELLPYLLQNNLINPSGIDLNNLPSGRIDVWVDVIRESASQQVLSSNNWGVINIADYAPPQAFVPSCGDQLDTNAMFHNFTWTPPVPFPIGLGIEVVYDFAIYHWVDPNNNSALGGNSILVYQQYDLVAPTTQVSDFDVQWQTGGTYLWTVTARVLSNGIPVSLIENGGVSAPCTFVYGEELSLTDQLADGLEIELFTEPSAERKGKAWWTVTDNTPNQGLSNFDEFIVEYRKQPTGNEGFEIPWFSKTVNSFEHFIYQLEPSTTYEVKVSGVIAGSIGDPTPIKTFTTPDPRVYNCGEADMPYLPSTYTVLENATVGTQVQIGQFTMTMTEVNEFGGGHYAGKGTIPIAFLGGAKAKVRFDDILIDTEYRVHEGRVDVITQGLESWLDDQMIQFIDPYYVNGVIDSAWVDTTAGVAWVTVNGVDTSFTFNPPHHPIIVNDENGNQYTIYPNGTIVVGSFLAISENWNAMPDEVIHFAQNDSELRGFDGKEHIQWHENYEIMLLRDSSKYFVANKSMAKDEADYVNVEIPSGASASLQLSDGTPINASPLQGTWLGESLHTGSIKKTLTLPAQSSTGNYSIYAIVNNEKVGQLNIKVYSKKERELVVVPIASTNLTAAQIIAELDETLGEANIEVDVEITPQWTDTTGTFTASTNISLPTEVGLLTKYSDDMREIRDLYFEQNPNADKSKYYIFLVNGFDDPNELGYMVRGRAMGFVKASQPNVLQTISHELAHGMGALEHSWKDNGPGQGTTHNLMDYEKSPNQLPKNNLIKAQWKELRDLDVAPSLFDDVDDYMSQLAGLNFDEISNQAVPTGSKTIHKDEIPVEKALLTTDGALVRFSNAARSRFTHFNMHNGKLIGLYDDTVELQMITSGYQSVPAPEYTTTFDRVIENEVGVLVFFRMDEASANARVFSKALKGTDIIDIVTGFASGDVTQIELVDCNEVGGEYIADVDAEVIYGQVECANEGECSSTDLLEITSTNKTAVKNAFKEIIQSSNNGFNANPIRFIGGHNHVLTIEDQMVIQEKINTLHSYRDDIIVGVVVMKDAFGQLYTQTTADQLVNDVMSELASEHTDKQLVLFFTHYITGSNENLFTTDHYTCVTSSYASSNPNIVNPVFTTDQLSLGSNVMNNFMLLFTEVKKPYYLTNIYEHYDGSISYLEVDNTSDVSRDIYGIPFVKGARHLVSVNQDAYNSLLGDISGCLAAMEFQGSQWTMNGPGLTPEEAEALYAQKQIELESMIQIWKEEDRNNPNDWIAGETDFTNVKERYLEKGFALKEFEKQNSGFEFFQDIAIVQGISTVSSDMYYDFDIMSKVIDPIVYGVVDALGVIPGIDYLADGVGLLYATARGDGESMLIYGASLAVPFVGAGVIYTGYKSFSYYAKQSEQNIVDLVIKQWDEAPDGWIKVSNDIPYDDANKTNIKNQLESEISNLTDESKEVIEKVVILKKSAAEKLRDALELKFGSKTNILQWIDELPDNSAILKKLEAIPTTSINNLEIELSLLKTHFNNNAELVTSWTRFGDSPLRTNPDYLEGIIDYPKTWSISFNGSYTMVNKSNGTILAKLYDDKIVAPAGSPGSWNELLNKIPVKNQAFHVDDFIFETDAYSRVKKVTGELENIERGRNKYQQGISVQLKDGTQGVDDGGHLIANILNGPGEQINYLPQIANLNRGDWKAMENTLVTALQNGKQVEIEIIPIFIGSSKRPSKFEVEYWIDGEYELLKFNN